MLEEVSHSCNQWTQLSESVEQQVTGLHDRVEVLRVTALAQKQKGDPSKPAMALLERGMADLQAQLAAEQKSHRLTQVLTAHHIQSSHLEGAEGRVREEGVLGRRGGAREEHEKGGVGERRVSEARSVGREGCGKGGHGKGGV